MYTVLLVDLTVYESWFVSTRAEACVSLAEYK